MTLDTWLSFALLEVLLCFSPGPAVIYTTATAAARGGREGMAAAGGILTSNLLYFILSATGVAALLIADERLFTLLRWAGGLYLIWMGLVMMLKDKSKRRPHRPRLSESGAFLRGFLVQSANPKSLVFFVALLPQFIDAEASLLPQVTILAVTSLFIELAVLSGYVWMALRVKHYLGEKDLRVFRVLAGAFLVFAGSRLTILARL